MRVLATIALAMMVLHSNVFAAVAPAQVDGLSSSVAGNDISLTWSATVSNLYGAAAIIDHYNIYRATTPNFVPDYAGGSNRIAQPTMNSFTDAGAATSDDSYYYRVTAVTNTDEESLIPSALAGKTRFDLTYNAGGSNRYWVALPQSTVWTTASDLGNAATGISKVIRFDPDTRSEQVWDVVAGTGTDFALTPGEGVAIEINANTTLNVVGVYDVSPIVLNHNVANFNHQWLSVPLPSAYSTASEIAQAVSNTTKVARFDTANDTYQSWVKLGGDFIGEDFPVAPGVSIVVSVTSASSWTPETADPDVAAAAVPDTGYESITVELTANASDADGTIASIQWDLNNDGVFDTTGPTAQFTYLFNGEHYPTVLVTDNDGHRALAYATVMIDSLGVSFNVVGFNPGNGESATIDYTLPLDGTVTVRIYDQTDTLMKTLVASQPQTAGPHSLVWDGSKDGGGTVDDGAFYVTLDYTVNGFTSTYDTRLVSGGLDNTQTITGINVSNTLSPLQGEYVEIDYTLSENSMVSLEIRDSDGSLVKTLLSSQTQATGLNSIVWDGTDNLGQIVTAGSSFTVNIRSTSLATNSLVVTGGVPVISNVSAAPLRFSPVTNPYGTSSNSSVLIDFDLNKAANVTLTVFDSNGVQVGNAISNPGLAAGTNQVVWNGQNSASKTLAAAGTYTVQLQAESGGQLSSPFNVQTQIFY